MARASRVTSRPSAAPAMFSRQMWKIAAIPTRPKARGSRVWNRTDAFLAAVPVRSTRAHPELGLVPRSAALVGTRVLGTHAIAGRLDAQLPRARRRERSEHSRTYSGR